MPNCFQFSQSFLQEDFSSFMLPNPVTGALKVLPVLQRNASVI